MINWARITELREEIGAEDFEEVVELFLSEVEERLETVSADKSFEDFEEDMHFLKGSALNLGFEELARLCSDGESRAASKDAISDIASIFAAYEKSKQIFLSKLSGEQAA
ncbi:Hpt domain-containing protein [Planktotalea sp.]|uniref:Hpt domain-containing protein n=1 Tax=Planktotalea sp. TaxID=2029877 RepID=UPI003D6C6044